jgi:branched-chain amino acid transport system permease protein
MTRPSKVAGWIGALIVVAGAAGWGIGGGDVADVRIATIVLMYVALAQGWNVLGGYAGYVNFGMVIFFGVGAYTTAIGANAWHVNALTLAPVAGVAAGVAAAVIGVPTLRLRGGYFAIATFVLSIAVQALALILGITHGSQGIEVPLLSLSLDRATRLFFVLFLGLAVIATLVCWALEQTRWRSALVAIREDEDAAEVLGVPTTRLKAMALVIGAMIAGIAGSLYATQLFYIEPTGTFDFNISLAIVVAAVIGGSGTWLGPVIGGVVTQLLAQELFVHVAGVYSQLSYGVLLVVVVLAAPRGLISIWRPRPRRSIGV